MSDINDYAKIQGDTIKVDLKYPRGGERPKQICIELWDVRAADSLLIEFDFKRNGWVIRMDKTKETLGMMEVVEEKVEVAFIPAWNEVLTPINH